MKKRYSMILKVVSDGHEATVSELSNVLKVSPATVRQDLTILEQMGFLQRVHGGAVLNETDIISNRMAINYNEKLRIAQQAASYVNAGDTIFVESGSVNVLFVREISKARNITIITSNAFIAHEINQQNGLQVVLIGGLYQKESESVVGNLACLCIDNLNYGKTFIGVDGFSKKTGFTGRDIMRAEIVAKIIKKSNDVFILTDSSKFGKIFISKYCDISEVNHVITDAAISSEYKEYLAAATDLIIV